MTLIVSVLSPQWAMQGSDRRFTIGTDQVKYRDGSNKAVFAAERFAFAFTGRASIDGQPSDEWLQLRLARLLPKYESAEKAFGEIAILLSGHFAGLPDEDRNRALAFVGVGWTDDSFSLRMPLLVRISNLHSSTGAVGDEPTSDFSVSVQPLDSASYLIDTAGVAVEPGLLAMFEAQVDSLLSVDDDVVRVARAVVEMIRAVAAECAFVGRGVMLNSLPRAPGPPDGSIHIVGGLPERSTRSFAHFSEDDGTAQMLSPLVVSSDGAAFGELVASGDDIRFPALEDSSEATAGFRAGFSYSDPAAPPPPRKGAIGQSVPVLPKFGRNDPCWCESGRKYKKCHGA